MTPGKARKRVILDRLDYVEEMLSAIKSLPLDSYDAFTGESRNIWAAESCLRRALEALLDVGRHLLAKCFAKGVSDYKAIATGLGQVNVLSEDEAKLMESLAGYRNRMVHFYHEITAEGLYRICRHELSDIIRVRKAYASWIKDNPDKIDELL